MVLMLLPVVTIVCGVNAFIFIVFGWFKTVYWLIRMAQNTLPDVKWYKPIRKPSNAIYRPDYVTEIGQEYRHKHLSGIRFLLAGVLFGLPAFAFREMESWTTAV